MRWVTPRKYSDETGLNYAEVLKQCKKGEFNVKKSDGGHFYIGIDDDCEKTKEELIEELTRLRAIVNAVKGLTENVI